MNRREFNKLAVTVGASVILDSVTWAADSHQKNKKPNILFIMTDQQHAGMMSCAGNKWLHTPALDSLAQEGIRFENAYCTNPVCVPSRTSMATGVMSCRLGASDNKVGMSIRKLPSEVDTNSLGKILKRAGYDTFYGGKVHMCKSLAPKNAGYDQFFKDMRDGKIHDVDADGKSGGVKAADRGKGNEMLGKHSGYFDKDNHLNVDAEEKHHVLEVRGVGDICPKCRELLAVEEMADDIEKETDVTEKETDVTEKETDVTEKESE